MITDPSFIFYFGKTTIETESKLLEQSSPKFIKSYLNLYLLNVLKATFAQNFFWNKFDVNVNDVEELLNFSLFIKLHLRRKANLKVYFQLMGTLFLP